MIVSFWDCGRAEGYTSCMIVNIIIVFNAHLSTVYTCYRGTTALSAVITEG